MQNVQNVDDAEIKKFAVLASRWWDEESEFKPLHDINPLRLDYIKSKVNLEAKKVLDVGCGGGILSESLNRCGADVTAIDMGDAPLSVAKLHLLESGLNVDYQKITAEEFAQDNAQTFDVVTCLEMLEHVPSPASVVEACCKMVKPGGHLFFSTINRNPKAYLYAVIGAEYVLNILPKGTHQYEKFIRPAELSRWIRQLNAGYQVSVSDMIGMTYNPFTKVYQMDKQDVSVNYLIHCESESSVEN
jgi:2-polyprenyl-6-hydroxyphenyl methylase / 3-demethylubiquinone-9 3-methyltransferase